MTGPLHAALRAIPSVDEILREPQLTAAIDALPQAVASGVVRDVLDVVRQEVRLSGMPPDRATIVRRVSRALDLYRAGRPARVVNGTGIILHTNLGRAVLGDRIARRLSEAARGYSDLELEIESGERGQRESQCELLLRVATSAEAALVVNNCAAAVLLLLDTLARGREVIVSRGELVEIGGAFRMPDVLERSGARMVEVGTTNKTKLADYRLAVSAETSVLLKVHTSNFRIMGFTESVSTAELAALARELDLVLVRDLGSGSPGLPGSPVPPEEPTLSGEIRAGAHVVAASGDKLLGGPQAGIIVGRRDLVRQAARNPLYRALRPDKLTLAALSETLLVHLEGKAAEELPALRMLATAPEVVAERARALAAALAAGAGERARVSVVEAISEMGGGSLPERPIRSYAVQIEPRGQAAHRVEARLRMAHPPVLVRLHEGRLLVDPRTLLPGEEDLIVDRLVTALGAAALEREPAPGDAEPGG